MIFKRDRTTGTDLALRTGRVPWRLRAAATIAGLAVTGLVGGWVGLAAGTAVGTALWWAARRWSGDPAEDVAAAADLPVAVDLLAAALRAGVPPARAAEVVGQALGGPLGPRLGRVGTALRLGTHPQEAWTPVAGVPGADRLRRAAARSADSGAAMAGALSRLADDLRAARTARAEAGAQRLGVLVVLPLGLCFLPAFVLTGVVPVVVAVLGDVLRSR
jgi:Flp pilus assembly protein TadB